RREADTIKDAGDRRQRPSPRAVQGSDSAGNARPGPSDLACAVGVLRRDRVRVGTRRNHVLGGEVMTTLEMLRRAVESIEMEVPLTLAIPKGMEPKRLKSRIVGDIDINGMCYVRHQFDAEAVLKWLVESK
ncbi:MAG: hypothetical protein ACK55I_26665, partial [bacterium]